jgi:hypothetical protein
MVVVSDANRALVTEEGVVGNIIVELKTVDGNGQVMIAGGNVGNIIAGPTVGDSEGLVAIASKAGALVNPRSRPATKTTAAMATVVTKIKPSIMITLYFCIVFVNPRALWSRVSADEDASQTTSTSSSFDMIGNHRDGGICSASRSLRDDCLSSTPP